MLKIPLAAVAEEVQKALRGKATSDRRRDSAKATPAKVQAKARVAEAASHPRGVGPAAGGIPIVNRRVV